MDGWYIDLDLGLSCEPRLSGHGFLTTSTNGTIREIPTFKTIGKPEKGFPVELKSTSRDALAQPDGTKKEITSTFETRVTELSSAPLDPALFDIPAGFRRVDHLRREPTLPLSVRLEQSWQRLKSVLSRLFH